MTYNKLATAIQVGSGSTTICSSGGRNTYVQLLLLHNTSLTVDITVTLHITAASNTACSTSNQFWKEVVPAGQSLNLPFPKGGVFLSGSSESIRATASGGTDIRAWAYGQID